MQDKRVSHNKAGYSDKHRPAVPFGDFKVYSIFESAILTLLQIATKSKNSQWIREKLSIPILHLTLLSFSWGKQSVRHSAEHLIYGQKPKPTFSLWKYCSWLWLSFAVLCGWKGGQDYENYNKNNVQIIKHTERMMHKTIQ